MGGEGGGGGPGEEKGEGASLGRVWENRGREKKRKTALMPANIFASEKEAKRGKSVKKKKKKTPFPT